MNWTRLACRLVFMLSSPFPATASCLPSSTPEVEGIPSSAVLNWIDACEREIDSVHGFVLLRHGRLIAEGYWAPFSRDDTHMLYSHSKSFTSAAVGLLVDDGRLDLDEAVADFFPDKLPPNPSPGLLAMRVRDLLTMASGHDRDFIHDTCAAPDGDWLRHFFNQPLSCKPGTRYVYNTTGVYVLGAIVEQRAGEPLMDFLEKRLFSRIGIVGAWSTHCPKGHAVAGYGMNMRVRDLARFGQILLQKGVWSMHVPFFTPFILTAKAKFAKNAKGFDGRTPEPKRGDHLRQLNDPVTRGFIAHLQAQPLLKAILAGHLHIGVEERFSPTAMQYVVAGNYMFHAAEILVT